jgi:DMSO/TMAO reductase YedYZ heme-binding membrane subunit
MGISVIWRDYGGRFSWLKLSALLFALYPAAWLVLRIAGNDLGGRPVTELIHGVGDWAIRFLLITLAVTPARAVFDWPRVLLLRRMLGVTAACYAVSHLTLYCVDQKWNMLIGAELETTAQAGVSGLGAGVVSLLPAIEGQRDAAGAVHRVLDVADVLAAGAAALAS